MQYRMGKLAAVRPHGLRMMATYQTTTPPASVPTPSINDWGMLGNDKWGDCTIAGAAHLLDAWNWDYKSLLSAVPDATDAVKQYFTLTGGDDTGLVEATVLHVWRTQGLFDPASKILAYAPTEGALGIHAAVADFGGCYLGVQLPQSAEEQFQHGEPWTIVPNDPIVGGHCIVAVGYDPQGVDVVTWGRVQRVSYPWLERYCDEAWAIVSPEQAAKVDIDRLLADLNQVHHD